MKRTKPQTTTFGKRFYPTPIERKAEEVIATCVRIAGLGAIPFPIPVDTWVESPLGIGFGVEDLSALGPEVLGAVYIPERQMVISDRIAHREERFRFTCAHELGHLVLHGGLAVAFRETTDEPGRKDQHEVEADRFAAAFLMPMDEVVRLLLQIGREHQIEPHLLKPRLLREHEGRSFIEQRIVPAMQKRFGVSFSAALCRVREVVLPDIGPFMSAVRPPVICLNT